MDIQLLTSTLLFTPIVLFSLFALPFASWYLLALGYEAVSGWAIMATGALCAILGLSGVGYTSYHAASRTKQTVAVKRAMNQPSDLYLVETDTK